MHDRTEWIYETVLREFECRDDDITFDEDENLDDDFGPWRDRYAHCFRSGMANMSLDPKIKQDWTAALRSGEYGQAREMLMLDYDDQRRYCCLGVLAWVLPGLMATRRIMKYA